MESMERIEREVQNTGSLTFKVLEENLPTLEAKVKELKKAAYKCSVPQPEIKILDRIEETVRQDDGLDTVKVTLEVEVTHAFPQIRGWRLIAAIDHIAEGENVVRFTPTADTEGNLDLFSVAPRCDLCNTTRERKKTYLFEFVSDGTRQQVGRTCMKDFLGHHLHVYFLDQAEDLMDEDQWLRPSGSSMPLSVLTLLQSASVCIHHNGYKKAGEEYPTKDQMLMYATAQGQDRQQFKRWEPITDKQKDEVNEAIKWVSELTAETEYMMNLQTIVRNNLTERRYLGFIASLLPTYRRHIGHLAERAAQKEREDAMPKEPVPTGRIPVTGIIIKLGEQEWDGQVRHVMTVLDDRGFKVWGTRPAAAWTADAGDRISFTAELSPSGRDEHFGFFKRPTKVVHTPVDSMTE